MANIIVNCTYKTHTRAIRISSENWFNGFLPAPSTRIRSACVDIGSLLQLYFQTRSFPYHAVQTHFTCPIPYMLLSNRKC